MVSNKARSPISIRIHLTTWPHTLNKARSILDMAKQHREQSSTLSACTALILAAGLDQATWAKLDAARATTEELGKDTTPYSDLMRASLRMRITEMPKLLTNGKIQLNKRGLAVKALHSLVYARNSLLHIREGMLTGELSWEDPRVKWDKKTGMMTIEGDILDMVGNSPASSRLSSPWDNLTLMDGERFLEAVIIYDREVLQPEEIKPGMIVTTVR